MINRICKPADLNKEVDALVAVMAAKNPITIRRSKFALNKGADLAASGAMAFEFQFSHLQITGPLRDCRYGGFCKARYARRTAQGFQDFLAGSELVQNLGGRSVQLTGHLATPFRSPDPVNKLNGVTVFPNLAVRNGPGIGCT